MCVVFLVCRKAGAKVDLMCVVFLRVERQGLRLI